MHDVKCYWAQILDLIGDFILDYGRIDSPS